MKFILKILKKFIILLFLALPILLPIFYHIIYFLPAKNDFFVAKIKIGELLEYTGTTIGSIFLFFTVFLTIRNTRKDSKIEKIRDALADYLSILSPFFTIELLREKDPNNFYLTIKNFIDEENKKYQIISLYLSKEDKKLLDKEFIRLRTEMLSKQFYMSNNLIYNTGTKSYSFNTENNWVKSINQFGYAVAACLVSAENVFSEILNNYESSIF